MSYIDILLPINGVYMVDKSEMREIFKELSPQNQAKLTVRARQFYIVREDKKDGKEFFYNGNNVLYSGIRNKNNTRINRDP